MRELGQSIHDRQIRAGDAQYAKCERHSSSDVHFTILEEVVEGTNHHLPSDIFPKGDQGNTQYCNGLVGVLKVFRAMSQTEGGNVRV
jgi:hypothetical protein